jgi:hypothetical protein
VNTVVKLIIGTLLCFLGVIFAPNMWIGIVLGLAGFALLFMTFLAFVDQRMQNGSQGEFNYLPSPEEQQRLAHARAELQAKRAEESARLAAERAASEARLAAAKSEPPKVTGRASFNLGDEPPKPK